MKYEQFKILENIMDKYSNKEDYTNYLNKNNYSDVDKEKMLMIHQLYYTSKDLWQNYKLKNSIENLIIRENSIKDIVSYKK